MENRLSGEMLKGGKMLNTSSLFYSSVEHPTFVQRIHPSKALEESVNAARREVCDWLRIYLPRTLIELGHPEAAVKPRFFIQGSASYGTLNGPAWPDQQIDVDVGVYLPLSGLRSTGTPSQASSLFFQAMERALRPLIAKRNWWLDTTKTTCVRIVIHRLAHIDLPLYAIPDEEFVKLSKAMRADAVGALEDVLFESADLWENLPDDKVHLAHREYGWIKSDARPVKKWFQDAVTRYGAQLRRVVRYAKALRDYMWPNGDGPSSLLLMTVIVELFQQLERRDDLALLHVITGLPSRLREGVRHPVDTEESLTKRLGAEGVQEAASRFARFAGELRCALTGECTRTACGVLVVELGPRFPNDPARVQRVHEANGTQPARVSAPMSREERSARLSIAVGNLVAPPKPWSDG